ncbi:MAG: hypothetical protein ABIF88_01130 [archaeon]
MKKLEKIIHGYKEQKKTLASHLVAFGASTALGALASKLAADYGSDAALTSVVGTSTAMGVYWSTFIGGLIVRDRKELKDEEGVRWDKVKEKSLEYASWIGAGEVLYASVRGGLHAYLQKEGYEPETASAVADTATAGVYTVGLPFIQMGIDYTTGRVRSAARRIGSYLGFGKKESSESEDFEKVEEIRK